MTDPMSPNHDQPAEGSRDEAYSGPDAAATGDSAGAGAGAAGAAGAGSGAGARAADVLESIRDAVEDFAEKAAPTVRELSAKAAEIVATAADKAVPLAQKAGVMTADASGRLAEKSRHWASEVRDSLTGSDAAAPGTGTPADDGSSPPPAKPV